MAMVVSTSKNTIESMTGRKKEKFNKILDNLCSYSYFADRSLIETALFYETEYIHNISVRKFDKKRWRLMLNDEKSTFSLLTKSKIFDRHLVSLIVDFLTIRGKWNSLDNPMFYWGIIEATVTKAFNTPLVKGLLPKYANTYSLGRKIRIHDIPLFEIRFKDVFTTDKVQLLLFEDTPIYLNINDMHKLFSDRVYERVIDTYNLYSESSLFCL